MTPTRKRPILFRLRNDEYEMLKEVAGREHEFPARWARSAVLRALQRAARKTVKVA